VKRTIYLATAALVALLILAPTVMAQQTTGGTTTKMERTMESTQPLPKSGGPGFGSASIMLPAAALLLGSGILASAILRRRR
jgi:hypothetical protein